MHMKHSHESTPSPEGCSSLTVEDGCLVAVYNKVRYELKLPKEKRTWSVHKRLQQLINEAGSLEAVLGEYFSDVPNGEKVYSHSPDAAVALGDDYHGKHALWLEDLYNRLRDMESEVSVEHNVGDLAENGVGMDLTGGPADK